MFDSDKLRSFERPINCVHMCGRLRARVRLLPVSRQLK